MPLLVPGSLEDCDEGWYAQGYKLGDRYAISLMEALHISIHLGSKIKNATVGKVYLTLMFRLYPEVQDFVVTEITKQSALSEEQSFIGRIRGHVDSDPLCLERLARRIIKQYYRQFVSL